MIVKLFHDDHFLLNKKLTTEQSHSSFQLVSSKIIRKQTVLRVFTL